MDSYSVNASLNLLLQTIDAYHGRRCLFIKRTVNTDHLIGFDGSVVKYRFRDNDVDFTCFILENILIAASDNQVSEQCN